MSLETTPSQTIGPFFEYALLKEDLSELVSPNHPDAIRIEGKVYDGAGGIVPDAMIEVWQANAAGRYDHPEDDRDEVPLEEGFAGFGFAGFGFAGFGRAGTDEEGKFSFLTVKPGAVPGPGGGLQAPHVVVSIFARGLLKRLATRIYFPDEEEANADDSVLSSVGGPDLRSTLVAREEGEVLRFDIHLQGGKQTVFFDV